MKSANQPMIGQKPISDTEIVQRVCAGEKALYELLMRRHNQKLYRVIRSYLKREEEVEDAMQNTYLKAYEKLHQFHHQAQFATWLIRIGINEALGRLREMKHFATGPGEGANLTDHVVLELPDAHTMDPENKVIQKEIRQLLEKAIDKLPFSYRSIYVLREVEEMSVADVAACMSLSENNVKVRQHRAKLLLKEYLYEMSSSPEIFAFGSHRCDDLVRKVMASIH